MSTNVYPKAPRLLIYDIETSPVRAWIWRTGSNLHISHDQIMEGDGFDIICICWKWADEKKVYSLDWDLDKQNSTPMIEEFGEIYESADIAIAYNGDRFDKKHLNTHRLLKNLPPLSFIPTEDPLKQLRKHFYLSSYKLDYVAKILFGDQKDKMCFQDWIDIVRWKKPEALAKMVKYCKKDVLLLQSVYDKISPYVDHVVNKAIITGGDTHTDCKNCGSTHVTRDGFHVAKIGKYQRYHCQECGHKFKDSRKTMEL